MSSLRLKINTTHTLANGLKIPVFGLGVYLIKDPERLRTAIKTALDMGYRLIDTAAMYQNEYGVGEAVKDFSSDVSDVFITSKVWNSDQGYDETLKAFEESRKKLARETVDLYLIHWPVKNKYRETWKALEELYVAGKIHAIGVSNFQQHHLEDLMTHCSIKPMVNQIELHPRLQQEKLVKFCLEHNIYVQAWSPLMRGKIFQLNEINELAESHKKNPAQISLRWCLQRGIGVIPKSDQPDHIRTNAGLFDFELSDEEMELINNLDRHERIGPDPDNVNF